MRCFERCSATSRPFLYQLMTTFSLPISVHLSMNCQEIQTVPKYLFSGLSYHAE
jgi:hypothetical protein